MGKYLALLSLQRLCFYTQLSVQIHRAALQRASMRLYAGSECLAASC
jgi:hypothetical protein